MELQLLLTGGKNLFNKWLEIGWKYVDTSQVACESLLPEESPHKNS